MTACQNTPKTPALDMANFDLSVAPNADFYEYATGGWQKNNPLKPEYARYGSFDILRDNNEKRINELFSGMTQQKAEPGSVKQKISDLYKMGLDSVRLNAEGAAPIKAAVDGILAIGDRSQLTAAVARLHSSIANPFFGVGVQSDLMNSDINALYASQPDLIMGDRDYYLDPENESIRTAYKEYLGKIFRLSGVPEADIDKAVAGVLSIETKLAEKNWSSVELRNIPAMYNPTKKADFEKAYDAIDWAEYYKTMGIGDFEQIIVTTPSALANANELMKTAPLEEIRYYLAAQYIGAAASYLSDDFINASFDFFGRVMSGKQEQKPRWKRAMSVPNGTLSEAVGEMYVAKYFPEKDKVRMLDMVKNLQTALGQHIAALDWMSDATKAKAQEKLAAFTVKIGYPDKWKDYTTLKIDPAKSYWENIVEANAWYTSDNISKLGKPVDKDEWHMSPQTVNAYYEPSMNGIVFQELRESRGLAYSAFADYSTTKRKEQQTNHAYTYIISQNDKMMDCIRVFNNILDTMPQSQPAFELAQQAAMKRIASQRITKANIIFSYLGNKRIGINYDIRRGVYEALPKLTLEDIVKFEHDNMANKPWLYLILGDEKNLDMKSLEKIAPIKRVSTEEIFGY